MWSCGGQEKRKQSFRKVEAELQEREAELQEREAELRKIEKRLQKNGSSESLEAKAWAIEAGICHKGS